MSAHQQKPLSVTWNQVAAFRLARHHLLKRAARKSLASVAGEMAGVQAQLPSAAQIGIWSRVQKLKVADIQKALEERSIVKAGCMRQTLFFVPSQEIAVFVRGAAGRAEREIRWTLGKGVPERVLDAAIERTLDVLDEPLTRQQIADRVCRALGVQKQDVHGGGWGSRRKIAAVPVGELVFPVVDLLHLVASRGVVCYGPHLGNEPTFVRADAWIPNWKDMPREQAEDLLLQKYLHAFGPATISDFTVWSGITLRDAREIWARQESSITSVNVEGWSANLLEADLNELSKAKLDQPVIRLLPYFDTFLLGHKERDHLAGMEHRPRIYRAQGWIAPVVLVNGRAAAVWEYIREGSKLRINVQKFGPLSRQVTTGIREEVQDLSRFLGTTSVDLQYG